MLNYWLEKKKFKQIVIKGLEIVKGWKVKFVEANFKICFLGRKHVT